VAGCCECGYEPSGSCATELVYADNKYTYRFHIKQFDVLLITNMVVILVQCNTVGKYTQNSSLTYNCLCTPLESSLNIKYGWHR
jgi:hypothetical protein